MDAQDVTSIHAANAYNISSQEMTPFDPGSYQPLDQLLFMMKIQEIQLLLKPLFNMRLVVVAFGVIANIVNIRVFLMMGLEDSVTIVLFNIAVTDIGFLTFTGANVVTELLQNVAPELFLTYTIEPAVFSRLAQYIAPVFVLANALSTGFLAVQRCLCVLKPLQFKSMFTNLRTKIIEVVIWTYPIICQVPTFAMFRVSFVSNRFDANRTVLAPLYALYGSPEYHFLDNMAIVNGLFMNAVCQVTIVSCIFIMVRALRKSVQFRKTTTGLDKAKMKEEKRSSKNSTGIGNAKERQVVVQVILVSTIFILTHTHNTLCIIGYRIYLLLGGDLFDPYLMMATLFYRSIDIFLYIANSSLNIFVYLLYNTKYKQNFFKLINKNPKAKK